MQSMELTETTVGIGYVIFVALVLGSTVLWNYLDNIRNMNSPKRLYAEIEARHAVRER